MFRSWAVQCGSHMWLLTTWNVASINEKLNLTIYFILINLYLDFDSYMWQWLVFWESWRWSTTMRKNFLWRSEFCWLMQNIEHENVLCSTAPPCGWHKEVVTVIAAQPSLPSPFSGRCHSTSSPDPADGDARLCSSIGVYSTSAKVLGTSGVLTCPASLFLF